MSTSKCVDIRVYDNKLLMTFLGNNNMEREDFLEESIVYLFSNWFEGRMHPVLVIIREIVKNIFDHGTGKGILTLNKEGGNYVFEFIDHNSQKINFSDIKKLNVDNGWIRKTPSNYNVGLSLIEGLGKEIKKFSADDSKGGINYYGEYQAK